jgi:DNA-binding IclR family transcriptional regulator
MSDDADAPNHVRRTLRCLELLAHNPLTQTELARQLGVHPRTARRLLASLTAEGYVTREDAARPGFKATLKLVSLAGQVVAQVSLVDIASPFVSQLAHRVGAPANLSVLDGAAIVPLVEEGRSGDPNVATSQIGVRMACSTSAAGKAILAWLPFEAARTLILSHEGLGEALPDPAALLIDLAEVRIRGYAVDDAGLDPRAGSAAAPVFDHLGRVVAALGADWPPAPPAEIESIGRTVVDVARMLSEDLGFSRTRYGLSGSPDDTPAEPEGAPAI